MSWLRYFWLAVPVFGLCELLAHVFFAGRAPRNEDWRHARGPLEALRSANELVVIAPSWAEPLARHAFGERNMPLRDVTRADSTGYQRAIEVSILGARSAELAAWRELSNVEHGAFRLRVLENPRAARVRFDFVEQLGPERVQVLQDSTAGARACEWTERARVVSGALPSPPTFPARRFNCEGADYLFVGVTVIDDEAFRPRRCIWAHPPPGGPLRVRFRSVPVGRVIRGYGMLPWLMFRDGQGSPIRLAISIAGERIGTFVHHDGEGWKRFEFQTGAHAGQSADVEFEISSANHQSRQFCFQADTR